MDSWSNYCNRPISPAEQTLYAHLLQCVDSKPPDEVINRFRRLFIDARGYADHDVWRAIGKIVEAKYVEQEFKYILNRCCYILINRWLMQPRYQGYILELIELFESTPCGLARARSTQRMRAFVQKFIESEQYLSLKRLAQLIDRPAIARIEAAPLGSLIRRYPCLYEYSLLTEDSTYEQRQRIKSLRKEVQRQFEIDLSQYLTHRQLYLVRQGAGSLPADKLVLDEGTLIKNPTLLSDREIDDALKQFAGKVDGTNTHRDLARQFLTYGKLATSYGNFKNDLYEYLISSVDPKYGRYHFNAQLRCYLDETLPHCNDHQISDFLLVETCKKLLSFLVVENSHQPNHSRFVDLLNNLGTVLTVTLLLKIVLICRTVRPWLERRFAILFKLYEFSTTDRVHWLVEALEHLNVALSTNFGTLILNP